MIITRRLLLATLTSMMVGTLALAQDILPTDNTNPDYHPSPRYRESESHPLRVIAYALHPIGWAARELIFRPLSYFASSTPDTRAIMGYREPYDFRKPSCFSASDEIPNCRQIMPFNYDSNVGKVVRGDGEVDQQQALYFPDTNFDFDKRTLNAAGKEKVRVAAQILKREGYLKVVLEGHADSRGSEKYNDKLGLDRAEAVKAELVSQGIPVDTLSTVSFGETRPLFTEKEEWAYTANRRVHVRVDDDRKTAVAPHQPQMPAVARDEAVAPAKPAAPKTAAKPKKKTAAKASVAKKVKADASTAAAAVPEAVPQAAPQNPAPVAPAAADSAPAVQE